MDWVQWVCDQYGVTPRLLFGDSRVGGDYRFEAQRLIMQVLYRRFQSQAMVAAVLNGFTKTESVTRDRVQYAVTGDRVLPEDLLQHHESLLVPPPHEVRRA